MQRPTAKEVEGSGRGGWGGGRGRQARGWEHQEGQCGQPGESKLGRIWGMWQRSFGEAGHRGFTGHFKTLALDCKEMGNHSDTLSKEVT